MSIDILPESKPCTKCAAIKPLSEFGRNKLGRFGVCPACKTCAAAASRRYAAENREIVAARKKEYRSSPAGIEKVKAYNAQYAIEHADALREKRILAYHATKEEKRESKAATDKAYRERNQEDLSNRRKLKLAQDAHYRARNTERARLWYAANKDVASDKAAALYASNREVIKARVAAYQRANPEMTRMHHRVKASRRRTRLAEAGGENYTRQDVELLLTLQRWKCANCATSLKKAFHVDHRIPVAKGGTNDRGNIDLLCPKCNLAKSAKLPHVFAQENGRLL